MRRLIAAGKRPGIAISLDFSIVEIAESFAAIEKPSGVQSLGTT
jgi:hypothetical protein